MVDSDYVYFIESELIAIIIRLMASKNISTRMISNVSGLDESGIIRAIAGKWSPSLRYYSTILAALSQITKQLNYVSKSDNDKG